MADRSEVSTTTQRVRESLKKRYAREKRFKAYGIIAIVSSLSFLAILIITISLRGLPAFKQTFINLDVTLDAETLGVGENPDENTLRRANYNGAINKSMLELFPDVKSRKEKRALYKFVSKGGQYDLQAQVMADPALIGETVNVWLPVGDDTSGYLRGQVDTSVPEKKRRFKDNQITWVEELISNDRIDTKFNRTFFSRGDSREPELAGIKGAGQCAALNLSGSDLLYPGA